MVQHHHHLVRIHPFYLIVFARESMTQRTTAFFQNGQEHGELRLAHLVHQLREPSAIQDQGALRTLLVEILRRVLMRLLLLLLLMLLLVLVLAALMMLIVLLLLLFLLLLLLLLLLVVEVLQHLRTGKDRVWSRGSNKSRDMVTHTHWRGR